MHLTWNEYAATWKYRPDEVGILDAQRDLGIPETGVWDEITARTAERTPRCGCTDIARVGESRWGIPEVAWFVEAYPGGMSDSRALEIYHQAFASWSAVCGLRFRYVTSRSQGNIIIGAGRGRRVNFDGRGGTLAWAYLPSGRNFNGQLQVMFDLDELWTDDPRKNGTLLLNVAAHEIGHAIGLSHTNIKAQLLNPYYSAAIAKPQRGYDIESVVVLYKGPAAAPAPTPAPSPGSPAGGRVKAVKILNEFGQVYGASETQPLALLPANAIVGEEFNF